ncbi:FMN-binding protein, partial [Oceanospirillum sp. HFRX-1_2]
WKALWNGKKLYNEGSAEPVIELIKGAVDASTPNAEHKVDGLSGATLTSRGVTNLVQYWVGEEGFGPYLSKLRKEGV